MSELFWSAEELKLRRGHPLPGAYLLINEPNRTDKIGYLKKPITFWLNCLRELDPNTGNGDERTMQKIRHRRLSAIVVDLHAIKCTQFLAMFGQEPGQAFAKSLDDLIRGCDILLVHHEAMVPEIHMSRKTHHRGEYPITEAPIHDRKGLLLPDQWSCMKTQFLKVQISEMEIKPTQCGRKSNRLVVENQRDNVKARIGIGVLEASRLVHEYAQRPFYHPCKSKVTGEPVT